MKHEVHLRKYIREQAAGSFRRVSFFFAQLSCPLISDDVHRYARRENVIIAK